MDAVTTPEELRQITIGERFFAWIAHRPAILWRICAWIIVIVVSVVALWQSSVNIDGKRYFWIGDDNMISMRYAKNLAEGKGLVWNPGERVEGYTNFLWTIVMAFLHLMPLDIAWMPAAIQIVNLLLVCWLVYQCEKLLCFLLPDTRLFVPALLFSLALATDILFWSVNGFETTLLTLLFIGVVSRILQQKEDWLTCLLLGVLVLVRSDAFHVWAGAALLALAVSTNKKRTGMFLCVSLILPAIHFVFRYWYYGDWLPNTYYLKVAGVSGRFETGLRYLALFFKNYLILIALTAAGLIFYPESKRFALFSAFFISAAYTAYVGGDIHGFSRFMAHLVPLLFVLSFVTAGMASRGNSVAQFLFIVLICFPILSQSFSARTKFRIPRFASTNPIHRAGVVAGVLIDRHTDPQAKIAVISAGCAPYYSGRYALDLLGKSDPYIARQKPRCCFSDLGENKFDPGYSLGQRPDLVVSMWPVSMSSEEWLRDNKEGYLPSLLNHPIFHSEYRTNVVPVRFLLEQNAIYVARSSPEIAHLQYWKEPVITP